MRSRGNDGGMCSENEHKRDRDRPMPGALVLVGDRVRFVEHGQPMHGTVRSMRDTKHGVTVTVAWDGGVENDWPLALLLVLC